MRIHTACLLVSLVAFGGIALTGCMTDDYDADSGAIDPQPPTESAPNVDPGMQRSIGTGGAYPGGLQSGESRDRE